MVTLAKRMAVIGIVCGLPYTAAADPIRIDLLATSGTMVVSRTRTFPQSFLGFNIAGPDFSFTGGSEFVQEIPHCECFNFGQTISFSGILPGPFFGDLTFQGRNFHSSSQDSGNASFFLSAPSFVLPSSGPPPGENISFTTPFSLGGGFRGFDGPDVILVNLAGTGRATGTFFVDLHGAPGFTLRNPAFRYEFAAEPVPEPASLVLLGTGLAGVVTRTARRRRRLR
jgi:hypothetical protein